MSSQHDNQDSPLGPVPAGLDLQAEARMNHGRLRAAAMSVVLGLGLVIGLWFLVSGRIDVSDGPGTAEAAIEQNQQLPRVSVRDGGGLAMPSAPIPSQPVTGAPPLRSGALNPSQPGVQRGPSPARPSPGERAPASSLFVVPTVQPLDLDALELRTRPADVAQPAPDEAAEARDPAAPSRRADEEQTDEEARLIAPPVPRKPAEPETQTAARDDHDPALAAPQTAPSDAGPALAEAPLPPRRPASTIAAEPVDAPPEIATLTDFTPQPLDALPHLSALEQSAALSDPPLLPGMLDPTPRDGALDPQLMPEATILPPEPATAAPSLRAEPDAEQRDNLLQPTAMTADASPPAGAAEPVVATPSAPAPTVAPAAVEGRARVVVILDDMGLSPARESAVLALPGPLTLSYLPYAENLAEKTTDAVTAGHQLMLHLPMEPVGGQDAGPGALTTDLSEAEIRARTRAALESFHGYVAVNNHMGSRLTTTPEKLRPALREIARRQVGFVDSLTHPDSVAAAMARDLGMASARRDVFLDHDADPRAIRAQLRRLERLAQSNGLAIAIGHPHEATIKALAQWLPTLADKGIELVAIDKVLTVPPTVVAALN